MTRATRLIIYAVITLVVLCWLTWTAQEHVSMLRLFTDAREVATTEATVSEVTTPALREGEANANLRARVELHYEVNGEQFGRTLMPELSGDLPKQGDKLTLTYLKRAPEQALLESEMAGLDAQISGMASFVFIMGLVSLVVPFIIAGFGRKRRK